MNPRRRLVCLALVLILSLVLVVVVLLWRGGAQARALRPRLNDGQPWRIACYQGGDYHDYVLHLRGALDGLATLGWLEPLDGAEWRAIGSTRELWDYAREHGGGRYIEFVDDAFWSADWDDAQRERARLECLARLTEGGDIDMVLALGTWGGKDLAVDSHDTPVIVLSTSDPIRAGIIESAEDSGLDHVHARCDPDRYERNVRTFYRLVRFERLGLVYEDSVDGRIYGNVEVFRAVADELGFELVERHIEEIGVPIDEQVESLRGLYEGLGGEVDALILTALNAEEPEHMPYVIEPLLERQVATWGQLGHSQVRCGVLLSIAEDDFDDVGRFYAETIVRVLRGSDPRRLPQVFEDPKTLALNMETARRIGFEPAPGLLEVADTVFETIEGE